MDLFSSVLNHVMDTPKTSTKSKEDSNFEVLSFGYSKHGQLGRGGEEHRPLPAFTEDLKAISSGGAFSNAVTSNGKVYSWGDLRSPQPTHFPYLKEIVQVVAGSVFSIALDKNGVLWLWGALNNEHGGYLLFPRKLAGDLEPSGFFKRKPKIVSMASGPLFALFVDSNGVVYAWGENEDGLGLGDLNMTENPLIVPFFQDNGIKINAVACGGRHCWALSQKGEVYAWGSNKFGQLGTGNQTSLRTPTLITGIPKVTKIAAGDYHSLLITESGDVMSCGKNNTGQLGNGKLGQNELSFVSVIGVKHVIEIAAGGGLGCSHSICQNSSNEVFTWGSGSSGQLGYKLPADSPSQLLPKKIDVGDKKVLSFSCGWLHTLLLVQKDPTPKQKERTTGLKENVILEGLCALPMDLLNLLLKRLNSTDASRLGTTCKLFYGLCNSPGFWKAAYIADIQSEIVKNRWSAQRHIEQFEKLEKSLTTNWKRDYISHYRGNHIIVLPGRRDKPIEDSPGFIEGLLSSFFSKSSGIHASLSRDARILMHGLDAAGKTTIIYKICRGREPRTTIPTIGFNVEEVDLAPKTKMITWDVGGPDKIRALWRHYYQGANAEIFVVDSNDRDRIDEAAVELNRIIREDQLRNVPLLVFANKQDLPNAMSVAEVTDKLGLHSLRSRDWYIQASCAVSGDGLYEGLDWLSETLKFQRVGVDTSCIKSHYFEEK